MGFNSGFKGLTETSVELLSGKLWFNPVKRNPSWNLDNVETSVCTEKEFNCKVSKAFFLRKCLLKELRRRRPLKSCQNIPSLRVRQSVSFSVTGWELETRRREERKRRNWRSHRDVKEEADWRTDTSPKFPSSLRLYRSHLQIPRSSGFKL